MVLALKNVGVANPDQPMAFPLVRDVSCRLSAGEVLAVIGPNGAGKSSLLRAISGEWSSTGEVEIAGLAEDAKLRARQLSVLSQSSVLSFPYRVCEVVALGRIPHQSGQHIDEQIIRAALALMDIDYLYDARYPQLSGGEKQRVQLARVLAQVWRAEDAQQGVRLLLLDEPTAALDLGHQQSLLQAVREFAAQGVAIVMVLHDVNLAARYADQVLALRCGQVHALGKPSAVITAELMSELYDIQARIIQHPQSQTPMLVVD